VTLLLSCLLACTPVPAKPATSPSASSPDALTASPPPAASDGSGRTRALVTSVIDGDTIDVEINGTAYKLRYIGINAPELNGADTNLPNVALKATEKNRELIGGKTVELEKDVSYTDRYGRLLRYVYIGDLMVNAELVRLGFARSVAYPPDTRYQGLLNVMQAEARAARAGIWASGSDVPASNAAGKGVYAGSKKSNKYHYPSCVWGRRIASYNEIWFSSSEDARSKGYVPCKVCQPP
jgi:micrococcal nuclease